MSPEEGKWQSDIACGRRGQAGSRVPEGWLGPSLREGATGLPSESLLQLGSREHENRTASFIKELSLCSELGTLCCVEELTQVWTEICHSAPHSTMERFCDLRRGSEIFGPSLSLSVDEGPVGLAGLIR